MQLDIHYRPAGPVLDAFHRSRAFVRGIRGPFGSGKSTGCVQECIKLSMMQRPGPDGVRRSRGAVIRNTFPELKTTTIKTWHQWMPESFGRFTWASPPTHRIQTGDLDMEVIFLALDREDDVRKLLSLELTWAWINEARQVPKAILDALTGRVGRYPSATQGGAWPSGIILDTNSPDSDHWWYRLAEESRPNGFDFFAQPSGLSPEAENLEFLNQTPETLDLALGDTVRRAQGRRYYEQLAEGKDADWVKVYVDGEYGFAIDGKPVIHEYRDHVHCRDIKLIYGTPLLIGIDFGLTPAALIAQRAPNGQILWHDELVTEDMSAKQFGAELMSKLNREYSDWVVRDDRGRMGIDFVGDPAGEQRAQSDASTCFQMLHAAGIPARPAYSNDFALRREAIGEPLSRLVDGEPRMLVHPRCQIARKGLMGGYSYRRVRVTGADRFHDKPEKTRYSHVVDAGGYANLELGEGRSVIRSARSDRPRQIRALIHEWEKPEYEVSDHLGERRRPLRPGDQDFAITE